MPDLSGFIECDHSVVPTVLSFDVENCQKVRLLLAINPVLGTNDNGLRVFEPGHICNTIQHKE